jgi:mRNA interferase MazF
MTRGDVWWATFPQPAGRRPVLLLSRPEAYGILDAVVVAEVTTRRRPSPTYVGLSPRDGLQRACAVNLDSLHTVPKRALSTRITALSSQRMAEVDDALRFSLGMD